MEQKKQTVEQRKAEAIANAKRLQSLANKTSVPFTLKNLSFGENKRMRWGINALAGVKNAPHGPVGYESAALHKAMLKAYKERHDIITKFADMPESIKHAARALGSKAEYVELQARQLRASAMHWGQFKNEPHVKDVPTAIKMIAESTGETVQQIMDRMGS